MADTKYIYRGPVSGVTLVTGTGAARVERDVQLLNDQIVELPADHPYVKRLVAQTRLVAITVPSTKEQAPPAPQNNESSSPERGDKTKKTVITGKEPV